MPSLRLFLTLVLVTILDGGALVDWLRNQNYAVPLLRAAPDRIDGLAAGLRFSDHPRFSSPCRNPATQAFASGSL